MDPLIPLYALFAPFFAWPIELLLPYPYVVEELIKASLVSLSSKKQGSDFKTILLSGVFFSLSETVLYVFNFNLLGTYSLFFTRLLATSFLHAFTFLILFSSRLKGRKIFLVGIIFSMAFHYFFNFLLSFV